MYEVVVGGLNDPQFLARCADSMFRLRYRVFHERLGWNVVTDDGKERDSFDDAESRYIALMANGQVVGSWRLRPTTTPYMLKDVFAQLLGSHEPPTREDIWEISRFAIDTSGAAIAGFGLNTAARVLMRETTKFAVEHRIARYVMVASAAAERLYRHAGLIVHRFAPPQRIGGVLSVGCWVDIDHHTLRVMLDDRTDFRRAA